VIQTAVFQMTNLFFTVIYLVDDYFENFEVSNFKFERVEENINRTEKRVFFHILIMSYYYINGLFF